MPEKNCSHCKLNSLCVARIQLDTGKSDDAVRGICGDAETYAKVKQQIRSVLAENCRHFQPMQD